MDNRKSITILSWIFVLMIIGINISLADTIDDSVIHYWDYNDNSSTQTDRVGSYDGTMVGAVYSDSGKLGGAYSYDGDGDYMGTGQTILTSSMYEGSISIWVNLTNITKTSQMIYQSVASDGEIQLRIDPGGVIRSYLNNNEYVVPGYNFSANTWNHIVFTWNDSANTRTWYINGDNYTSFTAYSLGSMTRLFSVGGDSYGSYASQSWEGFIDEVAIFNTTLSQSDVDQLYNSGSGLSYPFSTITLPIINVTTNISEYINGVIEGECISENNITNVTINDSRFIYDSENGTYSDWIYHFYIEDTDVIPLNISCTDNESNYNSTIVNVYLDTETPGIDFISPISGYNTYNEINISVNYSDARLYNASLYIYYPNGSNTTLFSLEDINDTEYIYNLTIDHNLSGDSYGTYTLTALACDSHTNQNIDFSKWDIDKSMDNTLTFDMVKVSPTHDDISKVSSVEYVCEYDRCSWEYIYSEPTTTFSQNIWCNDGFRDVSHTDIPGHLICGDKWVDAYAEGIPTDSITITRTSKNEVIYTYNLKNPVEKLKTQSIGELNCREESVSYTYTQAPLPGFDLPVINADNFIGSIPDTASEVLMLFFFLALCCALTLYASYDRARVWWFMSGVIWFVFGWVVIHYSWAFGLICIMGSLMLIFSKS